MSQEFQQTALSLSVIIPAYNEEKYLAECLDSLLGLEGEVADLEIVVVDNGSTDRTASVARERGAVVVDSTASTIAGVRNDGAARSHGAFLIFLDADCTVQPGWAAAIKEDLQEEEVVAVGSYPTVPAEGSTWVQRTWSSLLRSPGGKGRARWLPSANMAIVAEVFSQLGGFNEELQTCEDADLSYRLAAVGKVVGDPRMSVVHHREPATLAEFFRKEIWHGKDSYRRMWRGGLVGEELPSLLMPLISLAGSLVLLAGLIPGLSPRGVSLVPLGTMGILFPPLLLSLRAIFRRFLSPSAWIPAFFLYLCYTLARAWALLLGILPSRRGASTKGS